MADKPTSSTCVVCGGPIVERVDREFDARSGPMIIGPASQQQFHDVSKGYHCTKCGLKYEFLPPPKKSLT